MKDKYADWRAAYGEDVRREETHGTAVRGRYFPTWHQGKGIWQKREKTEGAMGPATRTRKYTFHPEGK